MGSTSQKTGNMPSLRDSSEEMLVWLSATHILSLRDSQGMLILFYEFSDSPLEVV